MKIEMAGCNNQAVENVKSNIASQIAALQNEINDMQQTISRLENCNGTKENPHNHSSEIRSLDAQISANEELIRQLTELLKAVTEAKKTMEEADRKLRELVKEYQQGKIKRMTPTSAILSVNMECLEEKHKAGMISEEEYNQHLKKLSEMYISSLQSEIDTLTSNMEGLDACDPEYSGLLSRTTEKRKELISFVEEHNFSYPVSAKEIEAIKITNIINDLTEQYNNSISNEQKSAIWKTMQERRKQLEEIDDKLSNELLQIVTISKELNAEKVTSQVFDRLIPVAIRSTNKTAVNVCIDYKLKDVDGETRDEKLEDYFVAHNISDVMSILKNDDNYLNMCLYIIAADIYNNNVREHEEKSTYRKKIEYIKQTDIFYISETKKSDQYMNSFYELYGIKKQSSGDHATEYGYKTLDKLLYSKIYPFTGSDTFNAYTYVSRSGYENRNNYNQFMNKKEMGRIVDVVYSISSAYFTSASGGEPAEIIFSLIDQSSGNLSDLLIDQKNTFSETSPYKLYLAQQELYNQYPQYKYIIYDNDVRKKYIELLEDRKKQLIEDCQKENDKNKINEKKKAIEMIDYIIIANENEYIYKEKYDSVNIEGGMT